ncbi:hypothetical protein FEMY_20100 [Ferrovum myxofaciens]|jgi:hypothetical protein|uniref:Uncharacterized protein n=1 Tax=Ferrovum myxofaciens TaxID=416213 RepID=A0A149VW73_9PROT|nr:hypothetical protein FEMY_20100 [Ferrovum myxofaciens]
MSDEATPTQHSRWSHGQVGYDHAISRRFAAHYLDPAIQPFDPEKILGWPAILARQVCQNPLDLLV